MAMGVLYIVPTPIGNLEDITLRALRVLREVTLIAAEDTRRARVLLQHYDIRTPLLSYHDHNERQRLAPLLEALTQGDVALISDAGMPAIADPGYELLRAALAAGLRVEALPGPSALTTALVGSGLPTDSFIWLGFLPKQAQARAALLESLRHERRTLLACESPHRLLATLAAIRATLGERPLAVARELSKLHEEYVRGTVGEVLAHFEAQAPRGEIMLVIGGAEAAAAWDEAQVRAELALRQAAGEPLGSAARAVAQLAGWKRRAVYALGLDANGKAKQERDG